jgi:hypothetical protein
MPPDPVADPTNVELWVRSLARPAVCRQQSDLVSRLDRLADRDVIGGFDVRVWGREMVLSSGTVRTAPGRRFTNRYERFRRWADHRDASIEPFFERKDVASDITGEEFTVVVFPVVALAEFDGDEVVHVAPCDRETGVVTVQERLATIEAAGDLADPGRDGDAGAGETTERTRAGRDSGQLVTDADSEP